MMRQSTSKKGSRRVTLYLIYACMLWILPSLARAQGASQLPSENSRLAAAQAAFEALTPEHRKTIQSDLIWVASFTGAVSGNFGPLTYRALQTFQRNGKGDINGMPSPAEYTSLAQAAQKAREAVRFASRTDARSQTRIGLPEALLPRKENNALGGTRWQTSDQKLTIDTFSATNETLEQQFERLTAATGPNRKITYRLLRPEFFVITGETPTGRFYRRSVKGETELRGFSIGYDKAMAAQWDVLVLAITNAFEAFPTGNHTPALQTLAPQTLAISRAHPVGKSAPEQQRRSLASGLIIADGLLLTSSAGLKDCRNPKVGSTELTSMSTEASTGLVLANVQGLRRKNSALEGSDLSSNGATTSVVATALAFAMGGALPTLHASPLIRKDEQLPSQSHVSGVLQPGAAGAAIFDQQGRLLGLVVSQPDNRTLTAQSAVAGKHAMTDIAAIRRFVASRSIMLPAGKGGATMTTGQIVAQSAGDMAAITCDP